MNSEFRTQNFGISGYRLTEQLAESSALLVYRGYREADEEPVVLKILREVYPAPERIAWFKREYQVTRKLNLTGVVKAYACFCEQQQQLTVMVLEDFGGDSLARLGIAGTLELREFLELAIAIIQILAQIHAAHIIHKDINPSNIILNPTTKVVKIIDFGISTVLSQENSTFCHPNILEGTLPYMSPEQTGRMNRTIDYRSDFYSLGVTFYELLTGRLPFESNDPLELVHCHLAKQPPPLRKSTNREIPQVIGEIVMKLMEKNPEDCYQSAYGIQGDLELCLHQLQTKGQIDYFPLGKHDISDKFYIPQKLYGREREINTLLAAFERVARDGGDGEMGEMGRWGDGEAEGDKRKITKQPTTNNQIEMILISGSAGVGKSALVNEVHKPITAKRGNFISGKFDQYQRNIPYSAISQAFNQLCNHLLSESTATFRKWQHKILAAVGNKGQVLIDVIPNLELVIGQQQAVPQVGLQETQNRFNLVCQSFIKVLCQPEHPLVLFIDDLQWADTASLSLLRTIMSDKEIQHLLIIGAYRDNEVDARHPLKITLDDIKQESGLLSAIDLEKLDNYQVNALIAESLACTTTACQPLTDLIYTKTQGNPFFTIEFLRSLYFEGFLSFNPTERQWQWDLSPIQAKNITSNVVELMAGKISLLTQRTQRILQLAACIGNTFDLSTLAIISQYQPTVVWADLLPALQAGLVVPLNEQYKLIELTAIEDLQAADGVRFKFLHDQVQQAAYYLMDEDQRQATHLQIGRLLDGNTKLAELYEQAATRLLAVTVNCFYYSLSLLAIYAAATSDKQQEYLEQVTANQQQLKNWADYAPINFQHQYELVAAEKARVLGQNWEATEFYERAIKGARDNKYPHEEALAYELAAEFYLTHSRWEIAGTYLIKAHSCYSNCQTWAKVKDLEERYPQFFAQHASRITTTTSGKDTKTAAALDLTSILKASQALAGEIVLDNLLTKMLNIIIENAGAEIGYLLMEKNGQWMIEASGKVNSEEVKRRQKVEEPTPNRSLEGNRGQKVITRNEGDFIVELSLSIPIENVSGRSDNPLIANAIVNYVIRTQESIVLNDAAREGNFTRTPYILKQQPKSILCTPLLNQGKLVGILYLENNLTTEAFTPERLEVLNFLSSQAAISIENAKLYAEVQANESRLNQFLEAMPVGVAVLDQYGSPYYINQRAQELLGKGVVRETTPDTIAEVYDNYIAGTNQLYPSEDLPIVRALRGESTTVDDLEIHSQDKIIPVEGWGRPIYDQQGNIVYALVAFQDITERQQAQQLLANYNHTLEEEVAKRTEALEESTQRFKNAFETAAIGMCLVSPEGQFLAVNTSVCQILGYSEPELLSLSFPEITYPADVEVSRNYAQQLLAGEIPSYNLQKRYLHKNGHIIWALLSVSLVRNTQQQPLYSIAQIQDITEQKQAEEALKESEERYRRIVETSNEGIWIIDVESITTFVNPKMAQMLGYRVEEMVGMSMFAFIEEEGKKVASNNVKRRRQGISEQHDFKFRCKDGSDLWTIISTTAIFDEEGQYIGALGMLTDISSRKRAEQALRDSQLQYQSLVDVLPQCLYRTDTQGRLIFGNRTFLSTLGMTLAECLGKTVYELYPQELADKYTADNETIMQTGATLDIVEKHQAPVDNSPIYVQVIKTPVRDENGQIIGTQGIFWDVTERQLAEETLQQALAAAEVANRAKSTFLASTSHELRTPLNAILGFAQLMSHSSNLSPQHQKHIRIIHHSGQHLLSLINNVLDMSKVEAGSITLNQTNFDFYSLVDDLEAMFHLKALEKKLQLVFECSTDVPQFLHTDQLKLRQVLINLLNNAIKFTHKGSVSVRMSLVISHWSLAKNKQQRTNNKGQTTIAFEVEDTGIGIAPEELESIFEPFVQASTNQQFQEGTGLGLAISRKFVQLMGGEITVSSKVGSGTIFKVTLPVIVVEATTIKTQQPTRRVIALKPNQPHYRLLIVDDREYNRQLLVNLLSPLDFELREASNGEEAIEVWENWQPHLIWMDLRMPVMDGYEATQQIRVRERRSASIQNSIPKQQTTTVIIALTASSSEEERTVALATGCDDFIRKPFRESEIFEAMKQHLGVRYICEEVVTEEKSLPTDTDSQGLASAIGLAIQESFQGASILTPATIANLPTDWLANFQEATVEGDLDLMLTLIEQIRQQNHHLANTLASLANQFQFEELLALIEESGMKNNK